MIIKSITLNNYRLYRGKNTISLEMCPNKNIVLISGENGFGKTTFLHSLLWCLYGRLVVDIESSVKKDITQGGYLTTLKNNLNLEAQRNLDLVDKNLLLQIKKNGYDLYTENIKQISQYYIAIEFSDVVIPSIPCSSLRIVRSYDVILEKEKVDIYIDGLSNELTNEIGPEVFINDFILNKDIAQFFFFDSEQIVSLAETNTIGDRKKLSSAYNEVLGVRKYEELKRNLENLRLRFRKKSSDLTTRNKLDALYKEQDELKEKVESLNAESEALSISLDNLRGENEALQLQLMREGHNMTMEDLKRLELVVKTCKVKDDEYKKTLKQYLDFAPFAIAGNLFKKTRAQMEHDFQIRQMQGNSNTRNLLVDNITSDLLSLLQNLPLDNSLKLDFEKSVKGVLGKYKGKFEGSECLLTVSEEQFREFSAIYNNIISTYRSEFERLAEDYRKNKQILDRSSRQISNMMSKESDMLIKSIREKKNQVENKIRLNEERLKSIHELIGVTTQSLNIVTKQCSELSKKVDLTDRDVEKDKLAEQLISELSTFLVSLKNEKKYSLERRIKAILNRLMHKEDFVGRVEISIVDDMMDINLYSAADIKINKDLLSKGEQQLYATSILQALVEESGIQFPVFIDSPLQKFDKSHATKIITDFYPNISKQVILFPLLYKELSYEELQVMKPYVSAAYLIKNNTSYSYFEKVSVDLLMI